MSLDAETRGRVGEWCATRWTERDGGCPMCGCNVWDPHGYVVVTLSDSPSFEDHGPAPLGFPATAMTCTGCGFVALINMQRTGLAPHETT